MASSTSNVDCVQPVSDAGALRFCEGVADEFGFGDPSVEEKTDKKQKQKKGRKKWTPKKRGGEGQTQSPK